MYANELAAYGAKEQCKRICRIISETAIKGFSKVTVKLNDIGLDSDCNFYSQIPELFFKDGYNVTAYYVKVKNTKCIKVLEIRWGMLNCACEYVDINDIKAKEPTEFQKNYVHDSHGCGC